MEFYMKLPRNKKEFAVFMAIVSIISVNIIAPVITCFEMGSFTAESWKNALHAVPFIWLCVIALVIATSFAVECFIAQPIARAILFKMHKSMDGKNNSGESEEKLEA